MKRIIEIKGLEVMAYIGISEEERSEAQRLLIDIRFTGVLQIEELNEDLSLTIDYAAVHQRIEEIVQERPQHLIETLADDITSTLLKEFQLAWIELTVRKFILSNAESVSVTVTNRL